MVDRLITVRRRSEDRSKQNSGCPEVYDVVEPRSQVAEPMEDAVAVARSALGADRAERIDVLPDGMLDPASHEVICVHSWDHECRVESDR